MRRARPLPSIAFGAAVGAASWSRCTRRLNLGRGGRRGGLGEVLAGPRGGRIPVGLMVGRQARPVTVDSLERLFGRQLEYGH